MRNFEVCRFSSYFTAWGHVRMEREKRKYRVGGTISGLSSKENRGSGHSLDCLGPARKTPKVIAATAIRTSIGIGMRRIGHSLQRVLKRSSTNLMPDRMLEIDGGNVTAL